MLSTPDQMQISCLQLGYYLASWGMLRGSSFLLSKSVKVYERVIHAISDADAEMWTIDAHIYTTPNIEKLLHFKQALTDALPYKSGPSDTLTSKIMLGVFGNVPAFDTYFVKGFGVSTFGEKALRKISEFYTANRLIIDEHRCKTLDFGSGSWTERRYTRAKVIDMIFFIEGSK